MSDVERVYIQDWRLPGCNVEMVRASDFDAKDAECARLKAAIALWDTREGDHPAVHLLADNERLRDDRDKLAGELAEADARGERRTNAAARLTAQAWEVERDHLLALLRDIEAAVRPTLPDMEWCYSMSFALYDRIREVTK